MYEKMRQIYLDNAARSGVSFQPVEGIEVDTGLDGDMDLREDSGLSSLSFESPSLNDSTDEYLPGTFDTIQMYQSPMSNQAYRNLVASREPRKWD